MTLSDKGSIFNDIVSSPVAFLRPILPKYREILASSTGLNVNSDSMDELFARIARILGWSSGERQLTLSPISLATFTKKVLNFSQISLVSVIIYHFLKWQYFHYFVILNLLLRIDGWPEVIWLRPTTASFSKVTECLCFANLLQFLSVLDLRYFLRRAFLNFLALRSSEIMKGALFFLRFSAWVGRAHLWPWILTIYISCTYEIDKHIV